mmetsp:Transcript_52514/g.132094  ORF Transcript_52514/g.132094 Transcript_52514/m.132094 type:complete len:117 (+) Transcript_52514:177-527(+)
MCINDSIASQYNCFIGYWYTASFTCMVFSKLCCRCQGRGTGMTVLRAILYGIFIAPIQFLVIVALAIPVGLFLDFIWFLVWAISIGYCCHRCKCSCAKWKCRIEATDYWDPFDCLM